MAFSKATPPQSLVHLSAFRMTLPLQPVFSEEPTNFFKPLIVGFFTLIL